MPNGGPAACEAVGPRTIDRITVARRTAPIAPPTGHGTRKRPASCPSPDSAATAWPTLGVEIELQLVDSRSMALKSAIGEILADLPAALHDSVKPEFMQCYVEINTGVCRTVDEVEADLAPKIRAVERVADRHGVRLAWAATHPFSRWRDQQITPNDRYYKLAALLQETVVRPVTFGLHVHVGRRVGGQGDPDRPPDPAVPADPAGDVGQQPVLARAGDRPPGAPDRGAGRVPDRGHDAAPERRGPSSRTCWAR